MIQRQTPGGQPGRDRVAGVRDLPSPRHRDRGDPLRRGRRSAVRARGRPRRPPAGQRAGRHLPARRPDHRRRSADRRRRDPSRLRLPVRERRVRPLGDRRRAGLGRSGSGVDREDGLQGRGQEADGRGGRPGAREPVGGLRDRGRPATAGEGVGRWRRPRDADRPHPGRPARRDREGVRRGGVRVRRRDRLRRAVRRERTPRRGAGPGPPRRRARAGRAGLLDPASAPEGRRGVAGSAASRCGARRAARGRSGGGRGDRLPRSRHRRVPLRPRERTVLLPRDEHPAPGRAPGDRAGARRRSGRPAADGGRGPRPRPAGDRRDLRPRHRGAPVRRGPGLRLAAAERSPLGLRGPRRLRHVRPAQPAGTAGRLGLRVRQRGVDALRRDAGQGDRLGSDSGAGRPRAGGRAREGADPRRRDQPRPAGRHPARRGVPCRRGEHGLPRWTNRSRPTRSSVETLDGASVAAAIALAERAGAERTVQRGIPLGLAERGLPATPHGVRR